MVEELTTKELIEILEEIRPFFENIFGWGECNYLDADYGEDYYNDLDENGFFTKTRFRDCEWGATKMVFIARNYVLKIPFDCCDGESFCYANGYNEEEAWDYCNTEVRIYKAAKEAGLQDIFAPTIYLGEIKGYPIYLQDKVDCPEYRTGCSENTLSVKEKKKYSNISKNMDFYLDAGFMKLIDSVYGVRFLVDLLKFFNDNNVGDLHGSNIGLTFEECPIIFDYSGYRED